MTWKRNSAGLGLVAAFFVPAWWHEIFAATKRVAVALVDAYTVIYIEGEILLSACFAAVGFN